MILRVILYFCFLNIGRMELKNYQREGIISTWSNSKSHAEFLACASHNTSSDLYDVDILSVDLTERSKNLNVVGSVQYGSQFECLAWDCFGEKDGSYPYGLLFGGMRNGSFTIWNPAEIIGNTNTINSNFDEQKALLYEEEADEDGFPITCAEWNTLKNNYLVFGSTEVLLADVGKDVSNPSLMSFGRKNPHENSYVTSVAWNKEVNYILASAGANGLIALWDIKKNDCIFHFKDTPSSAGDRNVSVAWSKSIATQIAVTLDDEKKNQLQIWDLRNKKGPIIVIDKCHTKGINCIDWCDTDPDLLLTSSRDGKIICWDYKQDEEPLSTRKLNTEVFDMKWSKKLPSIYSVITSEKLSICSLDDKNLFSYVPKWHQVPAGTSFNGNDNIIVYSESQGNTLQQYKINVKAHESLEDELMKLEKVLNKESIAELKEQGGEEGEMWKLLSIKTVSDNDQQIYEFLGLNKDKIIKEVQKYTGKKRDSTTIENKKTKAKTKGSKANYIPVSESEAASFFGSLGNNEGQMKTEEDEDPDSNIKYDMVQRNFNWGIGKERLIKENILIGNYEGAIDAALKCGRTAEALIIAYSVDVNTFNSTLKTFFTETTDHFISDILKHIAFKDTEQLVRKFDLAQWRECMALIFSISSLDKRPLLLKMLAKRILEEENNLFNAAIYCYILAEDFQQIVKLYEKNISSLKSGSRNRKQTVVRYATYLLSIYGFMTKNIFISPSFERILKEAALVCLENNNKMLSYKIFNEYLPNSSQRYLQYLICNTDELHSLKKEKNMNVINLPIMPKKQEKKVKKEQNAPTNMKPGRKKPMPIQNYDEEPYKPGRGKKNVEVTPVEPPRPKGKAHIPPPPSKITAHHSPEPEYQEPQRPHVPQPPKKNGPPPPPPPKKVVEPIEQPEPARYNHPPPPSKGKNHPPPPPKIETQTHQNAPVIKEPVQSKRPEPPRRHVKPVQPEESDEQEEQVVVNTGRKTNPPPPPHKKPPPKPIQKQPSYEDDEEDVEQPPVKQQAVKPPPPPHKKAATTTPPPPSRQTRQPPKQVHYDEQEEQQEKKPVEAPRKVPPPPTANRRAPPPPKR